MVATTQLHKFYNKDKNPLRTFVRFKISSELMFCKLCDTPIARVSGHTLVLSKDNRLATPLRTSSYQGPQVMFINPCAETMKHNTRITADQVTFGGGHGDCRKPGFSQLASAISKGIPSCFSYARFKLGAHSIPEKLVDDLVPASSQPSSLFFLLRGSAGGAHRAVSPHAFPPERGVSGSAAEAGTS